MRFNDLSSVLFPQPDGPMSAVMARDRTSRATPAIAGVPL